MLRLARCLPLNPGSSRGWRIQKLVLLRARLGEAEWQRREPPIRTYLAAVLEREPELSTTAWLAVGYKPRAT